MHDSAHKHGRLFFELYWQDTFASVVELGSYDVNGTLRSVCPPGARYIGIDLEPGPGVDVVVQAGAPLPFANDSIDAVVSSSAFEHDVCFWETFLEQARVVRPGGLIYLNAPSNYAFHRYPLDCWRFYPDAGIALAAWATRSGYAIELVESFLADPISDGWADFVAVFRKVSPQPWNRRGRIADHTVAHNIYDAARPVPRDLENTLADVPEMRKVTALRQQLAQRDEELLVLRERVEAFTTRVEDLQQSVVARQQAARDPRPGCPERQQCQLPWVQTAV